MNTLVIREYNGHPAVAAFTAAHRWSARGGDAVSTLILQGSKQSPFVDAALLSELPSTQIDITTGITDCDQ